MKNTISLFTLMFLICFFSAQSGTFAVTIPDANFWPDLDGNSIIDCCDLQIIAENWLWHEDHESNPADLDNNGTVDFNDFNIIAGKWQFGRTSVAIFIDSINYKSLQSEIQRLKTDIENDLRARVFIFDSNWMDIKPIKDILKEKYDENGLIGAIFIGDIPTAHFEYQNAGDMPSDWYFQDFSDNFFDIDEDGKFEREYYLNETDITMRDIWTGRLKPPLGRLEGIEMLRSYLDRNHKYRTGQLEYEKKMLYFGSVAINQNGTSEQDYFDLINQINEFTGLYDSVNDVNAIYDPYLATQKQIYLSQLHNSFDFAFINIHGSATTQWLGGSTYVYNNEIETSRPGALFSVLASCSNGDFTQENYFAGWYLFSGDSLVATGNTVPTMLVGGDSAEFMKDYIPLGIGADFGSMYINDRSFMVTHVFGDPTLTMRQKPEGRLPCLSLDKTFLDFNDIERGLKTTRFISFENSGNTTLKIKFVKARYSINDRWENLGYWDLFYYKHPETGATFRDFQLLSGETKNIAFVFYPREDAPDGKYTMTMLFQTNDPEMPYIEIKLIGYAI